MVLSPACPAHGAAETVFADLQVGPFGHEWFRSRCSFEDSLRSDNASGGMNRVWARTAKLFSFFSDAHFVFLSTTWKCILESDTHRKEAMVPQTPTTSTSSLLPITLMKHSVATSLPTYMWPHPTQVSWKPEPVVSMSGKKRKTRK